jgi:prepilin-type N-terminal cleavage/methylation domain-containing protein
MRAMSACCHLNPEASVTKGFTLLELLVVLALMALAAGLVTPAAQRGIAAARERAVASEISALLDSLPVRAFDKGSELAVDEAMLRQWLLDLPDDWQVIVPKALLYSSTGVANGGRIHIVAPGRTPMVWVVGSINGQSERKVGADER